MKKIEFNRLLHRVLSVSFQTINRFLCTCGLIRPKVIIYMDGGICSQMHVYLCGECYRRASLEVLYDTTWFKKCGKDMDGRFDRKMELLEMFPNLPFVTVSQKQSKYYRSFFSVKNINGQLPDPQTVRQTIYLGGYYHLYPTIEYKNLFNECFDKKIRCATSHIILSSPNDGTNCAVHVRRGDLVNKDEAFYKANPWYKQIPDAYFFETIKFVSRHYPNAHYYFFSDEPDWVEKNIIPNVDAPCELIQGNKAYEDLLLISECDVVIASQGSFGTTAARLNGHSDLYIPAPETELGFEIKNFSKEVF